MNSVCAAQRCSGALRDANVSDFALSIPLLAVTNRVVLRYMLDELLEHSHCMLNWMILVGPE